MTADQARKKKARMLSEVLDIRHAHAVRLMRQISENKASRLLASRASG